MRISVGALLLVSLPLLGGCDPDTSPVPSNETDAGSAGAAGTGGGGSAGMGGGLGGTGGTGGGAGVGGEGGSAGAPEDAGTDVADDVVQEAGLDVAPDGPSCCPTDFVFTAAGASSVEMRGSPDPLSWAVGTPMALQGGTWVAEVCLDVTREYRYKFVIDGTTWVHDETKPTVDDGQGGFNNVIGPLLVCE